MVAGGNHHLGIGVDCLDVVGCPCDTGRRVASCGFQQYLFALDFRQLLLDEGLVALVGNQDDVVDGNDALEAVECHLQQASACAEEVDELFGLGGFAEGPKTATHTPAHDDAVSVIVHD